MMKTVPKITREIWNTASCTIGCAGGAWEICNKAIEIALAEQQEQNLKNEIEGMSTPALKAYLNLLTEKQEQYITAAQARRLGFGKVLVRQKGEKYWQGVTDGFYYSPQFEYRAIKQAQPEPVQPAVDVDKVHPEWEFGSAPFKDWCGKWFGSDSDETYLAKAVLSLPIKAQPEPTDKHTDVRAEYAKQVRDDTRHFYLWKHKAPLLPLINCYGAPEFHPEYEYRCTDISCYVSKDGESAIRMLRTEAQELQAKTRDECDWFTPFSSQLDVDDDFFSFGSKGTYTYRTKATIKLDGRRVTPEQAAAEWDAKKETHVMWFKFANIDWTDVIVYPEDYVEYFANTANCEYELRPKQPTWTGSREDVIALLKEVGVL
jgi:hypothetical protein